MSQTWTEKSRKEIVGDDEKHNFELAIIGGCLQRMAKAQEKIAYDSTFEERVNKLTKDNERMREQIESLINNLNDADKDLKFYKNQHTRSQVSEKKWWQFWK